MSKPTKPDQSGFCRHSKLHHLCHHYFETPRVILVCDCKCHGLPRQNGKVMKPKGGKVMVPKK